MSGQTIGDAVAGIAAGYSAVGEDRRTGTGEVGVLKTGAVLHGRFDPSEHKAVTSAPERLKTPVRRGTVLVGRKNSEEMVGSAAVVERDYPHLFLSDLIWELTPAPGVDAAWLAYALQNDETRERIRMSASGTQTTMKNLSRDTFRRIPLTTIPPLPEQRRVAEILRAWDEAINTAQHSVHAAQRAHDMVRSELYQRRYPDSTGSRFGDFLRESRVPGSHGATARKLSVRLYGKGAVPKEGQRAGSANTKYFRRAAGQLVYSRLDFLNGAFAILQPELDGFESTLDLPAFDIMPRANPIWLLNYLIRKEYYSTQTHMARGQRKARRVAPHDLLHEPIILPPRDHQDRIADVLVNEAKAARLSQRRVELLRAQKRGLMQKLLSGDVRVRLDEEASGD